MPVIDRNEIEAMFSVRDEVVSGGQRTTFAITAFTDENIRIQPTESPTKSRLAYNRLSVVITHFNDIDPKRIETSVGEVLAQAGMKDTQNESYLYGFAREYLLRKTSMTLFDVEETLRRSVVASMQDQSAERVRRLAAAQKKPRQITVSTSMFIRNPDVVAEVLLRASGVCERCRHPAPFNRRTDNSPYLEVHHRTPLAEGGDDTVDNALALCPNCHRAAHYA